MEHGEQVFQMTAQYIHSQRQKGKAYPIHITDIDVPLLLLGIQRPEEQQAIHFLLQKQHIERLFNKQ